MDVDTDIHTQQVYTHYNKVRNLFKVKNKETSSTSTDVVLMFLTLTNEHISHVVPVLLLVTSMI